MSAFNVADFLVEHAGDLKLNTLQWEEVDKLVQKAYDRGYLDYEPELIGALEHREPDEVQYRLRYEYKGSVLHGLATYSSVEDALHVANTVALTNPDQRISVQSRGRYGTEWTDWYDEW